METLPFFSADTDAREVIRWALEAHPDLAMPSGFNLNGAVLLDLAVKEGFTGDLVFIDTGYHFSETLETRDRVIARYPQVNVVTLNAERPDDGMFLSDVESCCFLRKVQPLSRYLEQKRPSALLNARSREQNSTRAALEILEPKPERLNINPLAHWTRARLEAYVRIHDLPLNPLYWEGFLSIGCAPCTRAVRPGEDARAGRWAGKGKTECGLWLRN